MGGALTCSVCEPHVRQGLVDNVWMRRAEHAMMKVWRIMLQGLIDIMKEGSFPYLTDVVFLGAWRRELKWQESDGAGTLQKELLQQLTKDDAFFSRNIGQTCM